MSENTGWNLVGTVFLIFIVIILIAIVITIYLLYRIIIMFYDLNKYKYNLLIVLLSIVTLVVLDKFTEISDFAIGLSGLITGIALLILSYYPLSNSLRNSNAKNPAAPKTNNA